MAHEQIKLIVTLDYDHNEDFSNLSDVKLNIAPDKTQKLSTWGENLRAAVMFGLGAAYEEYFCGEED